MSAKNRRFQRWVSEVVYWERPSVEIGRTMLIESILWLLARLAGWGIYENVVFWVAIAPAVFLVFGMRGAAERRVHAETHEPKPDLKMNIADAGFGNLGEFVSVACQIVITNAGVPSVAGGYTVTVTPSGGNPLECDLVHVGELVHIGDRTYDAGEFIYNKTASRIETGGMKAGLLLAMLPAGTELSDVSRPGTKITVSAQDVQETEFSTDFVLLTRNPHGPGHLPGLNVTREETTP